MEQAYTRGTVISGKPLTDGYHFAQTIVNDFGRPEQEGFNGISGMSGWASAGPFAIYVRGEYQYSPSARALPLSALEAITTEDFSHSIVPMPYPLPPDSPFRQINRAACSTPMSR
jgi:hypothetical protein